MRSGGVDQSVPSDEGTKWEDLISELEEKLSYLYSHIEEPDAIENAQAVLWKQLEEIYKVSKVQGITEYMFLHDKVIFNAVE